MTDIMIDCETRQVVSMIIQLLKTWLMRFRMNCKNMQGVLHYVVLGHSRRREQSQITIYRYVLHPKPESPSWLFLIGMLHSNISDCCPFYPLKKKICSNTYTHAHTSRSFQLTISGDLVKGAVNERKSFLINPKRRKLETYSAPNQDCGGDVD